MRQSVLAIAFLINAGMSQGAGPRAAMSWNFDRDLPADAVRGRVSYASGVKGRAMRFDGFTTIVVGKPPGGPSLERGLAIDAWIAPQEYSWNWTAIANQSSDRKSGFFFGIDYAGRIGLSVAVDGVWKTAVSTERVPLLRWSHVIGSFDPAEGLTVYINGKAAAREPARGSLTPSPENIWIGASQMLMGVADTEREPSRKALANTRMVFDGLIDEVNLYDRPLSASDARTAFAAVMPAEPQPLRYRVLPSGPKGTGRFGAFYEPLKYAEQWDALWRGAGPDIVVTFDFAPIRLVSWRGISYNPCWVTENGSWFSNEFMERAVPAGCAESMSDKQARFSSVKILEANDARVVLFWRYSPVDIHYEQPFPDPITGWGDWAEEFYTIYPDGVAARKFVGYSSVPRQKGFLEWTQSLPIMQPGQRPEDVLNASPLVTFANMDGRSQDYRWPPRKEEALIPDANIQVVHVRSEYRPFLVLTDRKPKLWLPFYRKRDANQEAKGIVIGDGSAFWWWNHWPVAMLPSDGRVATAADRPSHSWVANQDSAPWETTSDSETQIMLCGLTRRSATELVPLARSWMRAPELALGAGPYTSRGYDAAQRAYIVAAPAAGTTADLRFEWKASAPAPLVNPALVVEGWGESGIEIRAAGKVIPRGRTLRYGFNHRLEHTDLVVWLETTSTEPLSIEIGRR